MKNIITSCLLLSTSLLLLSACGGNEAPLRLEGERISIMELQESLVADVIEESVELPAPWKNAFWPQAGGYPNHSMQHLTLPADLKLAWRAKIGSGTYDRIPLTTQPIVIDGLIYTMDTKSKVRAFDIANGDQKWVSHVGNKAEDDPVISGGLSFASGRIYVTNGLNEIIALHPKTGTTIWRKALTGVSQAAPTILDGRIYVSTIDNRLLALNEEDGIILWEYEGISEGTGLIGGVSPAANREIVTPVFSSGEIAALRVENGSLAWSENLDSIQRFGGLNSISDIKASPVIDKGLLIGMNFGGRMAAIDIRTGNRVWQRDIGGSNTPWLAGENIFALSSDNHLIALSRKTGLIYWVKKLPSYEDPEDRKGPIRWQGPLLASNRLILAGSNGQMIEANTQTGAIEKSWRAAKDAITIPPIIAGETLYLLTNEGMLYAYR